MHIMSDKGKIPYAVLVFIAIAGLSAGCSIKEDRDICPCTLVLDFNSVPDAVIGTSEVYVSNGNGILYSDPDAGERLTGEKVQGNAGYSYTVRIPKTYIALTVASGTGNFYVPSAGVLIPLGEECPPVWMHYSEADATGERCDQTVMLHKDYCEISIRMLASSGDYPFGLTVKGGICGINPDRSVMEGDFSYSFKPGQDGIGTVRVPRQTNNGLVLQIRDDEEVLREFALGEYIAESGYDWSEENLDDIEVAIDYANSYVTIDIEGWSGSFEFDITI